MTRSDRSVAVPANVREALDRLTESGYEAYAVGGCVRDSLLGREPSDWDICTSALPEQTEAVFRDFRTVPTGVRHGTVTVILGEPLEITTFRVDGRYLDCRRPEQVTFTDRLVEDLARRDFTVNAMALSRDGTVFDAFGGLDDLQNRLIRCVGDAETRFSEDALRIMRAVRFAATLDFTVEEATERAVHKLKGNLEKIAVERVQAELTRLLGGRCAAVLTGYADVFRVVLPEAALDETKAGQIEAASCLPVKLALLTRGCDREAVLRRLRYPKAVVAQAIRAAQPPAEALRPTLPAMRRLLGAYGAADAANALEYAHLTGALTAEEFAQAQTLLRQIAERGDCVAAEQLAVSGSDLTERLGLTGRAVGEALERLLDAVIDGEAENTPDAIWDYLSKR
ncbi:MAG: CCA tRNA nucleotidyltransferase [Clostridia bacterium]|nr:CCA tRNA nucleotidyltransferase [Clostridia bacterium]